MNIHPSFVVKKENGLYVGKTSNDVAKPQEAKLYPNECLAKNACYCTEQIEPIHTAGDRIVIHRLYPNRWFQFDGELFGWTMKESEATIFASKEVAKEVCSKYVVEFKDNPERFCLEVTEKMTKEEIFEWAKSIEKDLGDQTVFASDDLDEHPLGTPENPIVRTFEYRGIQQPITSSLWTTPASQTSNESLAAAQIDYSITKEDLEKAVAKAHDRFFGKPPSGSFATMFPNYSYDLCLEMFGLPPVNPESEKLVDDLVKRNQKPYERTKIATSEVMKSLWAYQDAIKRFESWSSVVSAREFAPEEHPYIQFAQAIVDRDRAHKELVDLLRSQK